MLSFLNAGVLFAAAAALIPLIIHLFSKRRVKVVEFSSLRHLKAMQRRQVRRLKIRQLLLLVVRMLIILAVVLAFARPTTDNPGVGSHAAVSAVIILDNSASMNRYVADGNLFELARSRTEELLENFSQSDEVILITTGRASQSFPRFVSPALAKERLGRLKPGSFSTDLTDALKFATEQLAQASNLNKELYLVTDRQRESLPEEQLLEGQEINSYLVELPVSDIANCGLTEIDLGGQLIRPGQAFTLTATIGNFDDQPVLDQIVSLYLDGHRVAQTNFAIESASLTIVKFERSVSSPGYHTGWVELSEDKLPDDNRRYFSFRIPEDFNLLIIEGDRSASYVSLALSPGENLAQYWSVKRAGPEELAGVDFNDYDAVMMVGCPSLDPSYISRLGSFVRRGKSLFVSFGPQTSIDDFNKNWSRMTGVVYDEAPPKRFSRDGYYTFSSINRTHPIFSVFDLEQTKLPEVKFFSLPKMRRLDQGRELIGFTGGRPALVESTYGAGRVLLFTAPIDPDYSDLVTHSFFVPFISRVAEYLASDLSALETRLTVGEAVTRTVNLSGEQNYPVELIAPDSTRYAIQPEEAEGDKVGNAQNVGRAQLVIRTQPLDQPGIYRIVYLGRELDRFAINLDPNEGNLVAADIDQMKTALGVDELRALPEDEAVGDLLAGFRFGRELWQMFAWAAALLLIVEMILARGSKTDEPEPGD